MRLPLAREPTPDAPYWRGLGWLAAVDAAVWPLLWVLVFSHAPKPVGIVGPFVAAVALLCTLARLRRAMWENQRYRFTAWRWGRVVVVLLLVGSVTKSMLPA